LSPSCHPVGTQSITDIDNLEKLIDFCVEPHHFSEILSFMNYTDRTKFRKKYMHPLLEEDILELTIPDKPNSKNQKYRLTAKGIALKEQLKKQIISQQNQ
jgi:ATP-dependent DNA helicase RecG